MSAEKATSAAAEIRLSFLPAEEAILLSNQDYFFHVLDRIGRARESIRAAVFIVDVCPSRGGEVAKRLLDALGRACWLGLDVRVIVGRSRENRTIDLMDRLSFRYLRELELPVRVANPPRRSSLHSKYVLFDEDEAVLGSHNWAHFDLFGSRQTSVAVRSVHLARQLGSRFDELWASSDEEYR